MSVTYEQLLAQRAELEKQIAEVRKSELADAVASVRDIVSKFDLQYSDVFGGRAPRSQQKSVIPPKYRNPATGQTWTGRGKPPKWIQNENREQFAI
jgi:DNA-binding protein H-NS